MKHNISIIVLLIFTLISGISVVYTSYLHRYFINILYHELNINEKNKAEWGSLISEKSTLFYKIMENCEYKKINMHLPTELKQVG